MSDQKRSLDRMALDFHAQGRPGKFEIRATKPVLTQHDLALAYSPGVAAPCLEIQRDEETAYDYTSKGNTVAVISNGTAVLGLGNLGPLGAKPVMEGKAVLFKRFADIDGVDIEIDSEDVEVFIQTVRAIGRSFGGVNLEDIRAPDCFIIENRLRELLDVPVFHDDQHGTAIIAAAGFLNAIDIAGKRIQDVSMVVNGAGAAAIACTSLLIRLGVPAGNIVMCDRRGPIYRGREEDMNEWKAPFAVDTNARTLEDAMRGADVFFGLSAANCVSSEMVRSMAAKPVLFAMANPDPEIRPELVQETRTDAIIATGRSDYPNQVNNVLGFPYIFRGALDVRASHINEEMKIAAAQALARLAREDTPDEVDAAYSGRRLRYGPEYIIPVPFDPRLIVEIPAAVAQAAIETGVARKPIADFPAYHLSLRERLDPTTHSLEEIFARVRQQPCRIVFAEGEEERVLRAAVNYHHAGYGEAIVVGREEVIRDKMRDARIDSSEVTIINARLSGNNERYTERLYERLQRRGYTKRDCQRLVNQDRNIFAASMVACGDAEGLVSGVTRGFQRTLTQIKLAISRKSDRYPIFGMTLLLLNGRTWFLADTNVNSCPTAEELADIASQAAIEARHLGHEPRIAFLSSTNFGNPLLPETDRLREAVRILDERGVDFEYEGDISVDIALDADAMREMYPFSRLTAAANVLVMPDLDAAHISSRLLRKLGGGTTLGPFLIGFSSAVQIVPMSSSVTDLLNHAAITAYEYLTQHKA